MDAVGITQRLRYLDESAMVDTCVIRRLTGTTTDANGDVTPTYSTIYTGRCRIDKRGTLASESAATGDVTIEIHDVLHVPMSVATIEPDDVAEITTSQLDLDLVGRYWRIASLSRGTFQTSRAFDIEEAA